MVYGLLRALPGDRAFLSPSSLRSLLLKNLNASVEASEPHDFTVRKQAPSSEAPPASTASRPASVTIASRPSVGRDGGRYTTDLGQAKSDISEIPNKMLPIAAACACRNLHSDQVNNGNDAESRKSVDRCIAGIRHGLLGNS